MNSENIPIPSTKILNKRQLGGGVDGGNYYIRSGAASRIRHRPDRIGQEIGFNKLVRTRCKKHAFNCSPTVTNPTQAPAEEHASKPTTASPGK